MKRKTARKILKWLGFAYLMMLMAGLVLAVSLLVSIAYADSGYWGLFLWVCLFALGGVSLGVCNAIAEDIENWLKEDDV